MKTKIKDAIIGFIIDLVIISILCGIAAGVMQVFFILFRW